MSATESMPELVFCEHAKGAFPARDVTMDEFTKAARKANWPTETIQLMFVKPYLSSHFKCGKEMLRIVEER